MAVDLSGIPRLPDTESIHRAASSMRSMTAGVTDTCDDARWQWRLIENQIVAPDLHDEMVSALDVMQDFGLVIYTAVDEAAGALDEYADRIEGIKPRYRSVMTEAQICYALPTTVEEAEAARQRDAAIQTEVNEIVRQLQEWERECVGKIDAANRSDALWDGGWVTTPEGGASMNAAETLLDHLGVKEIGRENLASVVVMADVTPVDMTVTMGNGTVYEWHSVSPEHTLFVEKEIIIDHEVKFLPDAKASLPPDIKPIKHLLGPASIFVTGYSNFVDEWNDDLVDHPSYSRAEKYFSAFVSGGLGVVGDGIGSLAGGAVAGAFGLPSGPGAIVAGYGGDVVGGMAGEMVGNWLGNIRDGESLSEAWDHAWQDSGVPDLMGWDKE